ncbi:MAG: fluoride efflux transporter CrcB [Sedimentisphaerales bacterium]|nr:fluoride efflux transporter CrcB [Sedimentisphaerales bacterium]
MLNVLIVGLGGFVGSAMRYATVQGVHRLLAGPWYSYGTFAVNIIGCLIIGFLGGMAENRAVFGPQVKLFLLVGILGGFTTFSAFSYETLAMFRDGLLAGALVNIVLSVVLGLAMAVGGYKLSAVI